MTFILLVGWVVLIYGSYKWATSMLEKSGLL